MLQAMEFMTHDTDDDRKLDYNELIAMVALRLERSTASHATLQVTLRLEPSTASHATLQVALRLEPSTASHGILPSTASHGILPSTAGAAPTASVSLEYLLTLGPSPVGAEGRAALVEAQPEGEADMRRWDWFGVEGNWKREKAGESRGKTRTRQPPPRTPALSRAYLSGLYPHRGGEARGACHSRAR